MQESYITLRDNIVTHMVRELSQLGYYYRSTVEGCFESTQRHSSLRVPAEYKEQMKKECITMSLDILNYR